jgi:hypothetical protein
MLTSSSPARRAALLAGLLVTLAIRASAQPSESQCRPVGERTSEVGCWIMVDAPIGRLPAGPIFWHLDTYPTRAAAEEQAKKRHGTVVDALGRTWLFTIAEPGWRPRSGERVAEVGPLPVHEGISYSATYMEAISAPGMMSAIHTHSGPEAWFTIAGESCLETPQGAQWARAGGPPMIVPGGPAMLLTATGTVQRRAVVLILHDSSQPATTMDHTWRPKGLCKQQ